jgi:hypothetical protein
MSDCSKVKIEELRFSDVVDRKKVVSQLLILIAEFLPNFIVRQKVVEFIQFIGVLLKEILSSQCLILHNLFVGSLNIGISMI